MIGRAALTVKCLTVVLSAGAAAWAQECPLSVAEPFAPPAAEPAKGAPRIRAIRFEGQQAVGAEALGRRMEMKPSRFWRSARRSVFTEEAWAADHRRLCDLFRELGYVTAAVGPPEVRPEPGSPSPAVTLRIPVREGPRFRLGVLEVSGLPEAEAEVVRAGLAAGDVYRHGRLLAGLEGLRQAAGRRGQATWSATIAMAPRADAVVDVAAEVREGPPWLVGRIAFQGARRTRDWLLRRTVALDEGGLLDTGALADSGRRLDALGFVSVRDVKIVPSPRGDTSADVTFAVQERPVLRYGLSGGINALEGASVAARLGAVNALGRGERISGEIQLGQEIEAWELAAAVPYVFGTGWTAGLEVHARRLELEGVPEAGLPPHVRDADGFSLFATRTLGRRSSVALAYSLADISLIAESAAQPEGFGARREGRLSLTAGRDGWDHAWKPRHGLRVSGAARAWGGALGGDVDAFELRGRAFAFAPLGGRAALGAGAQAGVIHSPDDLAGLPFDDRYLLGGEAELRGFPARSVGPRDASGTLVAGTRFLTLHGEAHLDLPRGARLLAFVDAGNAWTSDPAIARESLRVSTGLELRFELPVLRLPLRLIGAANPVRDEFHPRTAFRVALGPFP